MTRTWVCRPMAMRAVLALTFGALGLSMTGPSGGAEPLEKELVVVDTGGAVQEAMKEFFYEPFEKATGVKVRAVSVASTSEQWAKMKAMAQVGQVEWDLGQAAPEGLLANRDLFVPIDCARLPNVAAHGIEGACTPNGVMTFAYGTVIAYNTRSFPPGQHPKSWADFWNIEKFPGPRALPNAGTPWEVLTVALLADGVAPERLFPLDIDRAFRKLDEIKPHVKVWWRNGAQSQQVMRDGEAVLAMMWSGRPLSLKAAGFPIEVEWNRGLRDAGYWVLLKGAPHPKAAVAFLDFYLSRPEAHLGFARKIFYDTPNREVLELLGEVESRKRQVHPDNWNRMVQMDPKWIAEHRAALLERWNVWIAR